MVTVENPAKITDVMSEVMSDCDRILRNTSVNSTSEDYIVTSSQACNSKLTIVNGEVEKEKNPLRLEEQVTGDTFIAITDGISLLFRREPQILTQNNYENHLLNMLLINVPSIQIVS